MDSTLIGAVAAVLVTVWHLSPQTLGFLISANLVGTIIGALLASLADRFGRKRIFQWALLWFSLLSLACAFAWNVQSLMSFRFLMGFGLGAELPVIAAYMSELLPASHRGRIAGLLNSFWPLGAIAAALIALLVIPRSTDGWRWAFAIGAAPAFLVGFSRRLLPESPRWLTMHGRSDEAHNVVQHVESTVERETGRPLPPVKPIDPVPTQSVLQGLFAGPAAKRTLMLWSLLFFAYIGNAGLFGWMPTLFVRAGFSLQKSFLYVLIMQIAYVPNQFLGAYLMDRWGRRFVLVGNGVLSAIVGVVYGFVLVNGANTGAILVMGILVSFFVSAMFGAIHVYGPEQYSTSVRATGYGIARILGNIGAASGPIIIGFLLPKFGTVGVFYVISASFLLASLAVLTLGRETRGRDIDALPGLRRVEPVS